MFVVKARRSAAHRGLNSGVWGDILTHLYCTYLGTVYDIIPLEFPRINIDAPQCRGSAGRAGKFLRSVSLPLPW